ncbi:hypothetical protein U1Q18_032072 [Sarracenia purpurea var. burkii]
MALKVEKKPVEWKLAEEKKIVAEKTPTKEEAQSREEAAEGGRSRRLGCWRRQCSSSLELTVALSTKIVSGVRPWRRWLKAEAVGVGVAEI